MGNIKKLLIVDDSEEILLTLKQYFSRKGHDVLEATNGLEAKKIFESDPESFDFIITDLVMPMISGLGLISMIRKISIDIPIIAITGFGKQPELLATEAMADVILEKPISLEKLESIVDEIIENRRKGGPS